MSLCIPRILPMLLNNELETGQLLYLSRKSFCLRGFFVSITEGDGENTWTACLTSIYLWLPWVITLLAVSYTHLDVYKRQLLATWCEIARGSIDKRLSWRKHSEQVVRKTAIRLYQLLQLFYSPSMSRRLGELIALDHHPSVPVPSESVTRHQRTLTLNWTTCNWNPTASSKPLLGTPRHHCPRDGSCLQARNVV